MRGFVALFGSCALALAQATPGAQAQETVTLEGRVVDLRGEGVPLAQVQVVTWQQPDVALAKGMCDGEGFFRIGHVPRRDSWIVRASSQGYCVGEDSLSGEPEPVRIQLQEAVTVRGVLRDRAGNPVPDATVRATPIARILHGTHSDARTDANGTFVLTGIPLGFVRFAAVVPGGGVAETRQLVQADAVVGLAIDASPSTSLEISVTGLPEEAITDLRASVLPYRKGNLQQLPPPWDRPRFATDGTCTLSPVPDLEYRVRPYLDGYAFAPLQGVVKPGAGPHKMKFTASKTGSASLQCKAEVLDAAGKPLPGVRLVMRHYSGGARAEATSDENGGLVFDSTLAVGTVAFVWSIDPRWVLDQTKVEGMGGFTDLRFRIHHECKVDPTATLQLRAIPACSVRGTVLRVDGRPAAFAQIMLESFDPRQLPEWTRFARATVDRDGLYQFPSLHPIEEPVRIKIEDDLGAAISEPFSFDEPGMQIVAPELKLSKPATVEGKVVDAQNRPAPGIRVWLRDWDLTLNTNKSSRLVEVITDRQGRYRFVGVPPGGAVLEVLTSEGSASSRAVAPFEVEAGKTCTFDLPLPAK